MEYTNEQLLEESVRSDTEAMAVADRELWQQFQDLEEMIAYHYCTEDSEVGCDCHDWRVELEQMNADVFDSLPY